MSEGRYGEYKNPALPADLADALLYALLLLHLPLSLLTYLEADTGLFGASAFVAVCLCMFLARRCARRVWLFFPLHIILVLSPLLLGGYPGYAYAAAALIMAVMSTAKRVSETPEPFGKEQLALSCALSVGAYAVSAKLGSPSLGRYSVALAVAVPTLYLVLQSILNANSALAEMTAAAPVKRMQTRLLALMAALCAALPPALSQTGLGSALLRLLKLIGDALLIILRFLVRLLLRGDAPPEAAEAVQNEAAGGFMLPQDAAAPNPIWDIIAFIVVTAISAAMVIAACYGLYRLARHILKRFGAIHEDAALTLTDPSQAQIAPQARNRRREGASLLGGSTERRVRRLFIKAVRQAKAAPNPAQTAREIAAALPQEDKQTLAAVYEKARYGQERVTREEYEAAKKAVKR